MDVASNSKPLDSVEEPATSEDGPSVAQLLAAFAERHDDVAFEQLTRRLGPMVFGVCRRVIGNHHDAEEVFQATFLALARYARRISSPERITVWLHRVAFHTALRAKSKLKARQKKETAMIDIPEPAALDHSRRRELESVLDRELDALPEIYREAVLLCDLEGRTYKEAAEQIGCPQGTLASRLARAHELLANRLTRRGIVVTSATMAVLLAQNTVMAAVPAGLITSTVTAASTVSVLPTSFVSVTAAKFSGLSKGVAQIFGFGKVAVAGIAGTGLLATCLALQQGEAQPPAPPQLALQLAPGKLAAPLDEIVAAYRRFDESIKSLRVEFQETIEILQDKKVLYEKEGIFPTEYEIPPTKVMAVDGDKIAFRESSRSRGFNEVMFHLKKQHPNNFFPENPFPKQAFTADEFFDAFAKTPYEQFEAGPILYDGQRFREDTRAAGSPLWKRPGSRPTYIFHAPTQISWEAYMPLPFYLNGRYVPDVRRIVIAKSDGTQFTDDEKAQTQANAPKPFFKDDRPRKRYRLADALETGDWRVVNTQEPVDGSDCVLIESKSGIRLWLDPAIGYAVRRMKTKEKTVEYSDFRNVVDGFQIAGKYEYLVHLRDRKNPSAEGEVYSRNTGVIVKLEVNEPIDKDTFTMDPPVGAEVVDTSRMPSDTKGNSNKVNRLEAAQTIIEYRQPANPADVPSAIKAAQMSNGTVPQPSKPNHMVRWLILGNAGVLLVVGIVFIMRRKYR